MKKKIGEKIYKVIMNKGIEEVGDRDLDSILGGLLMILPSMIMKFDLQKFFTKEFATRIWIDCLFKREIEDKTGLMFPLCKHNETRKQAIKYLTTLYPQNESILKELISFLKNLLIDTSW